MKPCLKIILFLLYPIIYHPPLQSLNVIIFKANYILHPPSITITAQPSSPSNVPSTAAYVMKMVGGVVLYTSVLK